MTCPVMVKTSVGGTVRLDDNPGWSSVIWCPAGLMPVMRVPAAYQPPVVESRSPMRSCDQSSTWKVSRTLLKSHGGIRVLSPPADPQKLLAQGVAKSNHTGPALLTGRTAARPSVSQFSPVAVLT